MNYDDLDADALEARLEYLRTISQAELFSLSDDSELSDATYSMIARVHPGDEWELVDESDIEYVVVLVSKTHGIICNGGFEALLAGQFRADPDFGGCLRSLLAIGASKHHSLLSQVLRVAGEGAVSDRFERFESLPKDERWALATAWFKEEKALMNHLASYIRTHRGALEQVWRRMREQREEKIPNPERSVSS